MTKNKIKMDMSGVQCMTALSEGNIGAVNVLTRIARDAAKHDPQSAFGALGVFMDLDELGLYGSLIWQLYKDVCGQNIGKMIAVLRAWQLGYLSETVLLDHVGNDERRGKPFENFNAILTYVKNELPEFKFEVVS